MYAPAKRLVLKPAAKTVGNDSVKYAKYSASDLELIRTCVGMPLAQLKL